MFIPLLASLAMAGDYTTKLDAAKSALKNGNYKEVTTHLKKAKQAAPGEKELLTPIALAELHFVEALSPYHSRNSPRVYQKPSSAIR